MDPGTICTLRKGTERSLIGEMEILILKMSFLFNTFQIRLMLKFDV